MSAERPAPPTRLDSEKLDLLRRWGTGLAASGRDEEVRAAGRALLLLIEELDALQRDLWHARAGVSSELAGVDETPRQPEERDSGALVERLHRRLSPHRPATP